MRVRTQPSPPPGWADLLREKAVGVEFSLSSDIDPAVGDGRYAELDADTGLVAASGLATVVEFVSEVGGVVGVQNCRSVASH